MLSDLVEIGASWKVLPSGIHNATLDEVEARFAINQKRRHLFKGLQKACRALQKAGCREIFLDGSYVTEKPSPNDYDVCWNTTKVDLSKLDRVFLDFSNGRKEQKLKYYGEFFPSSSSADGVHTFLQFFRIDKETGSEKGIVRILLQKE